MKILITEQGLRGAIYKWLKQYYGDLNVERDGAIIYFIDKKDGLSRFVYNGDNGGLRISYKAYEDILKVFALESYDGIREVITDFVRRYYGIDVKYSHREIMY